MDRATVLWIVVAFFGATVVFRTLRNLTEDQSPEVALAVQLAALAALVGIAVLVVRWLRSRR